MEERVKRMLDWHHGDRPGPSSIHLDTSNRCNLRCRFCWQRSHERKGWVDLKNELSDQRLLDLVDEAAELGVRDWLLSGGGEPMIRGDAAVRVMERIKRLGMEGDIITNGTLFTESAAESLVQAGWDRIRVSINGPVAGTHDYIVQLPGAFDRAVRSLGLIKKWKGRLGAVRPEIGFNTVINSVNYAQFSEIIGLLHELGGCLLNVQTIILYDNEEKKWALDEEKRKEFAGLVRKYIKQCMRYGIRTNLGEYQDAMLMDKSNELSQMTDLMGARQDGFLGTHCFEPWYLVTVRANGIVGSCRLFGDEGTSLHTQSLGDIWYGDYYNNTRKRLIDHKLPEYCRNCGANEFVENQKLRDAIMHRLQDNL
ncbi:MAG: radical SAM protein [archaeon]